MLRAEAKAVQMAVNACVERILQSSEASEFLSLNVRVIKGRKADDMGPAEGPSVLCNASVRQHYTVSIPIE